MIENFESPLLTWLRQNSFRLLFPLTLPWIPLFLFANDLYSIVPDENRFHHVFENLLIPLSLLLSVFLSWLLYRGWPAFLLIPKKVSLRFLVTQVIFKTLFVYIFLTAITIVFSILLDPPPWKTDNLQYIPLVFFAVIFYPVLLTPPVAIVAIWRALLQEARTTP